MHRVQLYNVLSWVQHALTVSRAAYLATCSTVRNGASIKGPGLDNTNNRDQKEPLEPPCHNVVGDKRQL